jgi:hypothetical protein
MPIPTTGLIVEYDFQNGSYSGSGTTITDLVSPQTNLTVGNGHWIAGSPNYWDLQGDTNLLNTSPGGSFNQTTFTINCWYYPGFTNPGFYCTVWSLGTAGNPTRPMLATEADGDMNIQWNNGYAAIPYIPTIAWHLFTFVSNGTTTTLYVDGALVGSSSSGSGTVGGSAPIRLGCGTDSDANNATEFAYGRIGYWSYYDIALNSTNVSDLYNATQSSYAPAPPPPSPYGLVGGRTFGQGFAG